MRKILFRGKRESDGKWIYGLYTDRSVYGTDFPCIMPLRMEKDDGDWAIISETVGQFTGLTDKNGNKIFEGDIVRTKKYGKIVRHCNVNGYDTFKIVYVPAIFRIENKYRGFNLVGNETDYEVIGNIHDNPELI
ncbi:MAG: YopX family protein [Ruminococcus sp.]